MASFSSSSFALTIEDAWNAAKYYDPIYQQSQLDEQISETGIRMSRSALLPSAEITASSNWNDSSSNTNRYGMSLTQTIWDSSKWAALDQSEAEYLASKLKFKQSHNDLAERLINAYLALAQSQGDLRLAQQKFDEGTKMLHITELRYKAGKIHSTELEDMRVNYVDERAEILANQSKVADKKAVLIALINITPDVVYEIDTTNLTPPKLIVNSETAWLKLANDNSPELLAAKQNVRVVEFGKDQAKSSYYPTLTGSVGYKTNDEFNASLNLRAPLDLNGATSANVDRAKLRVLRAKEEVRAVQIRIKSTISNRYTQLSVDWERVEIAQQQVESRQRLLKNKQIVYDAGMAEASDVIDAHNRLFGSKNALQSLFYQYWQHRISLLKSVGKLDDNTITMISQALQS
ncbi:TolC family protein [Moritella viscosa]|uniref:Outer membrane protein TolC n=2 Tax=Moritella viscosa TaxID=80854 RepID=A0A1L0A3X5_9GAMM|nr:Outer membrane protein TolC [Moritella viscosa]SHO10591.1 Outer membrane protein TolC [Moritella viscosa]SHO10592.1 Outer membrane protein TolC [Moritella viscosa]SHO15762.1 Outer membrane protein TolC [Moritella viscosa]SHO17539.1 Outer membrane protein TolC [Moritella viscosa]